MALHVKKGIEEKELAGTPVRARQAKTKRAQAQSFWHVQRVKRLIRHHVTHGAPCLISVRETICEDPACPGPVTDIRLTSFGVRNIHVTLHKSVFDIDLSDVIDLL